MIVRVQNERGVYLHLQAEVSWATAVTGEHGECTITIPRRSPAWDEDVIDVRGAFPVDVMTPWGIWNGVANKPSWPDPGMRFVAQSLSIWLEDRTLESGSFASITAGLVVEEAYRQGMSGLGAPMMQLGEIVYGPPLVPEIAWDESSTFLDVLRDLMEITGQEWVIDDRRRLHWLPHAGQYHDLPPIVDDGRLFPSLAPGTLDDMPGEFVERDPSGPSYTAVSDGRLPLRPIRRAVRD
ncbi:MAG: hypothetical protein ACOC9Y_05435 [Chloroflexota bacterium]